MNLPTEGTPCAESANSMYCPGGAAAAVGGASTVT